VRANRLHISPWPPAPDAPRRGIEPTRSSDELDATAKFYDLAAARYDAEVDGEPKNASIRDAFRTRVSAIAGRGALILDFGCGTGTDAAWYVARGHRVIAYDLAPRMVDALRIRCQAEIEAGLITTLAGRIDVLVAALERVGAVSVIAANFAVLSHVRDLGPLLQMLAPHLVADGALMVSVLNPFYRHDMRRTWWWRGALRSLWTGAIKLVGDVTTYRHFTGTVRRAAAPAFVVTEIGAASGNGWKNTVASNFLFLVLRKQP
jgi:SAM-dependent methyltransferase